MRAGAHPLVTTQAFTAGVPVDPATVNVSADTRAPSSGGVMRAADTACSPLGSLATHNPSSGTPGGGASTGPVPVWSRHHEP
jgi:hypothetical protein